MRIGNGFDFHPWSGDAERVLVLGGVRFEGFRGLSGFSDADVLAHACIDAVLSPAGLGDVGSLFPDDDVKNKDANSLDLFRAAVCLLQDAGWQVVNIDCTVVLDSPKISSVREDIQRNLSEVAGAPVTVKGKRTEASKSLTDGVRCYAVALVQQGSLPE